MKNFKLALLSLFILNTSAIAQTLPDYVPTDGLVGWWPFTGNANDSSGNGNNGVVTTATLTQDRFGNSNAAYFFNGIDSRIDVADAASLRCRKITMSAWVKKSNIGGQLIYKGSMDAVGEAYSLNSGPGWSIKNNSNCVPGSGWKGFNSATLLRDQIWEHLVVTYDSTELKMYINGALDNSSLAATGLIDNCTGGGLRFGFNHLRYFASTGDPFGGVIDDIAIWNRALSPEEITHLFNASLTTTSANVGINMNEPQRSLHVKDVLRLEPRAYPPLNPAMGDIYFDSTTKKLRLFDGTSWKDCWQ